MPCGAALSCLSMTPHPALKSAARMLMAVGSGCFLKDFLSACLLQNLVAFLHVLNEEHRGDGNKPCGHDQVIIELLKPFPDVQAGDICSVFCQGLFWFFMGILKNFYNAR